MKTTSKVINSDINSGVRTPMKKSSPPKVLSGGKKKKIIKNATDISTETPKTTVLEQNSETLTKSSSPKHHRAKNSVVVDDANASEIATEVSEIDKVLADLRSVTAVDDSTGYSNK